MMSNLPRIKKGIARHAKLKRSSNLRSAYARASPGMRLNQVRLTKGKVATVTVALPSRRNPSPPMTVTAWLRAAN